MGKRKEHELRNLDFEIRNPHEVIVSFGLLRSYLKHVEKSREAAIMAARQWIDTLPLKIRYRSTTVKVGDLDGNLVTFHLMRVDWPKLRIEATIAIPIEYDKRLPFLYELKIRYNHRTETISQDKLNLPPVP